MSTYTNMNGVAFTDEEIESWAAGDESQEGHTGSHLGPPRPGRPGRG